MAFASSTPSGEPEFTDIVQLCQTAIDTSLDSLPGLSLIMGMMD